MQFIPSSLIRKGAKFGPKVEVGKMKIKTLNVNFFKCQLNIWTRAAIFELNEGTIDKFVKFKYLSFCLKNLRAFEKINMRTV